MTEDTILSAIGSTEPSDFNEFCRGLGADCPEDRDNWREVFSLLRQLEQQGLIEVSRTGNKIDTLILTDAGADRIRAKLDGRRGLFAVME